MPDLAEKQIQIPDAVMFRELEGESVLLNLDSEVYFGLDEVGTRIWLVLSETETVGAAITRLLSEYDVAEEKVREDLTSLMEELAEHGLITIDEG